MARPLRHPVLATILAVVGAAALLTACESPGGKVTVLSSGTIAIQPASTYAWAPTDRPGNGDPRLDNDITRERIKTAIDVNLAAKGFRQTDPATAQVLVEYHIGLQDKVDTHVTSFGGPGPAGMACGPRGCIGGYGWGMYGAPTDIDVRHISYVEGTLMLDLIDRHSNKLAWRATSQKRLDKDDASQTGVNAIVADMVKSLPGPPAAPSP